MRILKAHRGGYTLIEVLAALILMGVVVTVTLQGIKIASRAGLLGQRKAAAMRIAERVLDELIVTGEIDQGASNGTIAEGDTTYPWTMESTTWPEDVMTLVTVRVTFTVQEDNFDVSISTLYDPSANALTTSTGGTATGPS